MRTMTRGKGAARGRRRRRQIFHERPRAPIDGKGRKWDEPAREIDCLLQTKPMRLYFDNGGAGYSFQPKREIRIFRRGKSTTTTRGNGVARGRRRSANLFT